MSRLLSDKEVGRKIVKQRKQIQRKRTKIHEIRV